MGHIGKAIGVAILYGLIFVALPLAFIGALTDFFISEKMDPAQYFHGTQNYVLIFGSLLTIFAATTAYFDKGSTHRVAAGALGALFLILWGYFFINSMSIFYEGDTYSYTVIVPGIALILAISFSIRMIYRLVEFKVYRKEYLGIRLPAPLASPPVAQNIPAEPEKKDETEGDSDEIYF